MARGKELQDFVNAFLMGTKVFNDNDSRDSRSSRSSKKDDYADDNLSKYDSRLAEKNGFQKLFGSNDDKLSGADRGRAVLDAKYKRAVELGDPDAITKYSGQRSLFENQMKTNPFEELKNPSTPAKPDVQGALDIPQQPARPQFASDNTQPQDDTQSAPDNIAYNNESGPVYGADWSSLFTGATGGMVAPVQRAAIGGVMQPQSAVQSALPISGPPVAPDDEEPIAEPSTRSPDLNLSTDPEELAKQAAPAIAAGLKRINAELQPRGAVDTEDPEHTAKVQAYNSGAGRMSDDEIKQIDNAIDPDKKLTPSQLSAARLAAVYKFYNDKGDPETADEMAARVLLHNQFTATTRSAMAAQALKNGDLENGVKLLTHAQDDLPDAITAKAEINGDGTINYSAGYDRAGGFVPTEQGKVTKDQLMQLASNTASPAAFIARMSKTAELGKKTEGKSSSAGTKTDDAGQAKAYEEYDAAKKAFNDLPANASKEDRETAYNKVLGAYRNAVDKTVVPKGKSKDFAARNRGIVVPEGAVPAGTSSSRKKADEAPAISKEDADASRLGYGVKVDTALADYYEAEEAANEAATAAEKKKSVGVFSKEDDPESVKAAKVAKQKLLDAYAHLRKTVRAAGEDDEEFLHGSSDGKKPPKVPDVTRPAGRPTLRAPAVPSSDAAPPAAEAKPAPAVPAAASAPQQQQHQLPSGEILTPKDGKWMREPEFVLGDKLGPKPQLDANGQITALSPEQMKIRDQLSQTPRGREILHKWTTASQDEAPRAPRQPRAAPTRLQQVNDMIGILQQGRGMGTPAQNREQLQQLMEERAKLQGGAGR